MTIRKGRLWKQCHRCNKMYHPKGKYQRICIKCDESSNGKNYMDYLFRLQKRLERERKKGKP